MKQKLLPFLVMFVISLATNAQTADEILAKYLTNTGGVEKWKALQSYTQKGKDPVKLDEEQSKELKDETFEDPFIDYKKKGHDVSLLGTEEVDGVKCFKIQLVKNKNNEKDDVTEVHFFDNENYVPIMKVSYIRTGPSKGAEVKSYFSDYQEVGGLMFPFSLEQKMNGQTVSKLTMQTITLNDVADDSIFTYPKK